LKTLGATCL